MRQGEPTKGLQGWPVDGLWTETGFWGFLKSQNPTPRNTKAAQCAALSMVGPVGLEPLCGAQIVRPCTVRPVLIAASVNIY